MIGPFFTPKTQNSACLSVQPVARPSRYIYQKVRISSFKGGFWPFAMRSLVCQMIITHEPGNVDRVFISTLGEILDEPFLGLVMDKEIEMANAAFLR